MSNSPAEHPPPQAIREFGRGRIAGEEATSIELHLSSCNACALLLERLPSDPVSMTAAFAELADDHPPDATQCLPPGFELLGELGRGGMGVVYKARQVTLNRLVAIKVVLAGNHATDHHRERFAREAAAAAGVGHSNIVHVFESGTWAGQPYLVLEFCPGGTLSTRLRTESLSADESAMLVETLARTVQAAHDRGVVHRDLKPQNVLLTADGTPKVADFGLAKLADSAEGLTATGAVMGTPSYMAPEQAAGHRDIGPAADIYSLGAILYECLTGRPPFRGPTPMDTIVQVLEQEPEDPRTVNPAADPELAAVALKCLEKSPTDRYPSAAALAEDLARARRGEPVHAPKRRGVRRFLAWARREPGLAVRLAVLLIGAIMIDLRYRIEHAIAADQHLAILTIIAAWAVMSLVCQALFRREVRPGLVSRLWLGTDAVFLTAALALNRGQDSPLVVLYGLIIVSSGLWLRADLIRFTTVVAILGYGTLVGRAAIRDELRSAPLHHVIAVVALFASGEAVAYQVRRVRLLSKYFGDGTRGSAK